MADPREGTHYQTDRITYFALIGSQRSGTNFFREVMATHPNLVVHGEIMWPYPLPNVWHNFLRTMSSSLVPPVTEGDATRLVDDYFVHVADDTKRGHPHKANRLRAMGVDIKYNQLRYVSPVHFGLTKPPFLLEYFRERKLPIVHMLRRNLIHQVLSMVIAEQRDVYHNYGGKKFEGKVELLPRRVVAIAGWLKGEIAEFRRLTEGLRMIDVYYEDVAAACQRVDANGKIDPSAGATKALAEFLAVPHDFANPTTISKVVNRPYREIIANHAKVVKAIRDSEFSEFADTV